MIDTIIAKREQHTPDIVVLELVAADGTPLPAFAPGDHIDVEIAPGLTRQYSLCGDPAQHGSYRLGILRDPCSRGGSAAVHETFTEGRPVRVGEPRSLFPLDADAPFSVLVGGGIGITPMIAMAHALHRAGRPFALHYCARSHDRAAFLDELAAAPFAGQVHLHFDTDTGGAFTEQDLPAPESGAHVYVCGPNGFMTWVRGAAEARGYPQARIHQEFFSAVTDTGGAAFTVELARSGLSVPVPEGKSIVAALAEVGIKIPVSCEQGICGTCLCDVLDGIPDHRDSYLTDEEKAENDQILLCCSRAKTPRLTLDL